MLRIQKFPRPRFSWLAMAVLVAIPNLAVSQIRGPVSGIVYHSASHSLRPIVGVPGAAYLGASILQGIDAAFVAPDGNCAFVTREFQGGLVCGLAAANPADKPASDLIEDVDAVAWNQKGDTAVLCSTERMMLQIVYLRGELAKAASPVDLSPLAAKPSTLAINEDGSQVAVGVQGALYRISSDGALTMAAPMGRPVGAVFGSSGSTIYVLDQMAREIRVIDSAAGMKAIALTDASEPADDPKPVGLAVSDDGRKVWVALANQPAVRAYNVDTHLMESEQALDSPPSAVQRISSGSLYLLNSTENDRVALLVFNAADPLSVLFIPAAPVCGDCQ